MVLSSGELHPTGLSLYTMAIYNQVFHHQSGRSESMAAYCGRKVGSGPLSLGVSTSTRSCEVSAPQWHPHPHRAAEH